ncbi:MAG: hypothetical protein ACD_75C01246G0001, partial [uncultured bacterium]
MLGQHRHDDCGKFTALGLMDGDRIGQIELQDIILPVDDPPVVRGKYHHATETGVVDGLDPPDVAVKDIQLVIVAAVNDPVAVAKYPLAHLQLGLAGGRRIGRLLDHPVEIGGAQAAAGHRRQDLDFFFFPVIFGNPLEVEPHHRIDGGHAIVEGRPGMHFRQYRLQLLDVPVRLPDFPQVHVLKFFWDDKILLIGGMNLLLRPELIEIFRRCQSFQLLVPIVAAPFNPADEVELFFGCLIRIDEQTIDLLRPDSRPFKGRVNMRRYPPVDLMSKFDDLRFTRLAKNLSETKGWNGLRPDDIPQHIAGADRRQ